MNDTQILSLIEKLINKSKSNELHWSRYRSSSFELKPYKKTSTNTYFYAFELSTTSFNYENSFVCKVGRGYFFLMLYQEVFETKIYLFSQIEESDFSQIYASTENIDDVKIISQLKRLYNLIDASLTKAPIDAFIEDFLMN